MIILEKNYELTKDSFLLSSLLRFYLVLDFIFLKLVLSSLPFFLVLF